MGNKQDLIERLQLAMGTEDNDPNNDTDLLDDANELLGDDDDEVVVPAPTPAKKVVIKRDNPPAATSPDKTEASTDKSPDKVEETATSPAKIEAPAATETPAKVEKKSESTDNITIKKWTDEERAAARAARFAANAEDSKKADLTSEAKKESRAERFGLT